MFWYVFMRRARAVSGKFVGDSPALSLSCPPVGWASALSTEFWTFAWCALIEKYAAAIWFYCSQRSTHRNGQSSILNPKSSVRSPQSSIREQPLPGPPFATGNRNTAPANCLTITMHCRAAGENIKLKATHSRLESLKMATTGRTCLEMDSASFKLKQLMKIRLNSERNQKMFQITNLII